MLNFATPADRHQAEPLMQPALIRVIDNLRKQVETTPWQSEYIERVLWPSHATEEEIAQVKALAAQLDEAEPTQADELRRQLSQLPTPLPVYELQLTHGDQSALVDVWELCFRVCFVDYQALQPVTIDSTLRAANGEVDWQRLDEKARQQVTQALSQLAWAAP
jgi:hypothetical protein